MALIPFRSRVIADVGISFGDEGKGRLIPEVVSELEESGHRAGVVAKINGGANSGHTVAGLKLNLIPAGVAVANVEHLVIGAGVVANPQKFLWEGAITEHRGFKVFERLIIDERCMVSDFGHRLLDLACEFYRAEVLGEEIRGSTGRGITPAFVDEVGQWQIFYAAFRSSRDAFAKRLAARLDRAVRMIEHVYRVTPEAWRGFFEKLSDAEMRANHEAVERGLLNASEFDFMRYLGRKPFTLNSEAIIEDTWAAGQRLAGNVADVRRVIGEQVREGRYILAEFGQSYWLDKRQGFTPNVTASHTYTPEVFQSIGLPADRIHTMGVCKAYDTKVGTHLFIAAMPEEHPLKRKLSTLEFGVSTGRQRMVGWYDAVEKGEALRYGGFQDLVINKMDPLGYSGDWMDGDLRICVAYQSPDGETIRYVPRDEAFRGTLKPIYQECPGWSEDISKVRRFGQLPDAARDYVVAMVSATLAVAFDGMETPPDTELPNLRYIGVGPDPSQIIKDIPPTAELLRMAPAFA